MVERVEDVECEDSLRTFRCCWEPPSTDELNARRWCWWVDTVTKVDVDADGTSSVNNNEITWPSFRTWANKATMAKLISLTEILERCLDEKLSIPLLHTVRGVELNSGRMTYFNTVKGMGLMSLEEAVTTLKCATTKAVDTTEIPLHRCARRAKGLACDVAKGLETDDFIKHGVPEAEPLLKL